MDNLGYNSHESGSPPSYESSTAASQGQQISAEKPVGIPKIIESLPESGELAGHGQVGSPIQPGRCGIFCWKPQWMQRFPTRNYFITVFLFAALVKGMSGSYFPSMISSVQKRLKLDTETIGIVQSGNEVSQILFSLILSYLGGKGHRPRWIALGVLASAVAYFMNATPHFLYGSGDQALSLTEEYYDHFHNDTDMSLFANQSVSSSKRKDLNAVAVCQARSDGPTKESDCSVGDDSIIPLVLIFMAQFIAGIGSILFYTLSGPFIDDHMKPVQSPLMIAVTGAVRQAGPLIGYLIAFAVLRLYVNPTLTPLINYKDDRWLGAWWLGWVGYASAMFLIACAMGLFPRVVRTTTRKKKTPEINLELNGAHGPVVIVQPEAPRKEPIYQKPQKDLPFWTSLWDITTNRINLWNNLSLLCFGFAFSGMGTYFPKYLETVFKQSASDAALMTAASSIFFQVTGLLASGYVISRFQLRARTLAAINTGVGIIIILTLVTLSQLVCKQGAVVDPAVFGSQDLPATYQSLGWTANMSSSCSSDCNCARNQISPVCYAESRVMFYSACHAGCKSYEADSQTFSNCSCLPSPSISLVQGKCLASDCALNFWILLGLMAVVRFGASFGRIGNVLIPYRCVDRSQKSLASGLSFMMYSLVSIPSPIMYGRIIDSACILWGTKCGQRGSCLLYDDVKFAYAMCMTAAGLSVLGLICDVMLWYHVKDLKLYGEDEAAGEKPEK